MNDTEKRGVLVIDEDEGVAKVIADFLKTNGYEPYVVHSALKAPIVFKGKREEIGLIILDMPIFRLPLVVETFFRLKDIDPTIKVVITSGFFDYETAKSNLENEHIDFINKPSDWGKLAALITGK